MTTLLDHLLPAPRYVELDSVEVALPAPRVYETLRHRDFGKARLVRSLFGLRTLPARLLGRQTEATHLRLDDLGSTHQKPGFQILDEDPPHEIVVGAIGKVWKLDIPFVHVASPVGFAAFAEPGWIKVAWSLRVEPVGAEAARIFFEVRVDATDDRSMERFRAYFALIGRASRLIRRSLLRAFAREMGTPVTTREKRVLPGDEILAHARAQITHVRTLAAPPEEIWPWLVQMGWHRGGFYAFDLLDNGGERSAREIHPELQKIAVGDAIPAAKSGVFTVLALEKDRSLVLGSPRDDREAWRTTWAFALEPIDERSTRLYVRARAEYPSRLALRAQGIGIVHRIMQRAQLRHLAARVEGRSHRDDWRDVLEGAGGAARMLFAFLTPFLRHQRRVWGVDASLAARPLPGDDLVPHPTWGWTHGVEIDAPSEEVWPWIAQIGVDRGGFYSYQALENLVGCGARNAETIHDAWQLREGQGVRLHAKMPALPVALMVPKRALVLSGDAAPKATTSWLFYVEPIAENRTRLVSRYRSENERGSLAFGPLFLDPIGYAMDRQMLLGVKKRAEARRSSASSTL